MNLKAPTFGLLLSVTMSLVLLGCSHGATDAPDRNDASSASISPKLATTASPRSLKERSDALARSAVLTVEWVVDNNPPPTEILGGARHACSRYGYLSGLYGLAFNVVTESHEQRAELLDEEIKRIGSVERAGVPSLTVLRIWNASDPILDGLAPASDLCEAYWVDQPDRVMDLARLSKEPVEGLPITSCDLYGIAKADFARAYASTTSLEQVGAMIDPITEAKKACDADWKRYMETHGNVPTDG